jgi:hypothetical protein
MHVLGFGLIGQKQAVQRDGWWRFALELDGCSMRTALATCV